MNRRSFNRRSIHQFTFVAATFTLAWLSATSSFGQARPTPSIEPPAEDRPAADRYWTTRWEFDDIDVERLATRLRGLGIDTGVPLSGRVSVRFNVGVPWTSITDGKAYRFDGTLTSSRLIVDSVEMRDLDTEVRYRNGLATLTQLKATLVDQNGKPGGSIVGNGRLQLLPRGDAAAELRVNDIAIAPISVLMGKFFPTRSNLFPTAGTLSGGVKFRSPLATIDQVQSYDLTAEVRGRNVKVAMLPPADLNLSQVSIQGGRFRINELDLRTATSAGTRSEIRLVGRAEVPLTGEGDFSLRVGADDLPIDDLMTIANQSDNHLFAGKVDFQLTATGNLATQWQASKWDIRGSIASPSLMVAGLDLGTLEHDIEFTPQRLTMLPRRDPATLPESFLLRKIDTRYQFTQNTLKLDSFDAGLFGGNIDGNATIPLMGDGELIADLSIKGIRPVVRVPIFKPLSPKIAATLAGKIDWRVRLDQIAVPTAHRGSASLSASNIRVGDEPIGELKADLTLQQGDLKLNAGGELLGGTVRVKTIAGLMADDRWSDLPKRLGVTDLRFDQVSINQVSEQMNRNRFHLSGTASGHVTLDLAGRDAGAAPTIIPDATISLQIASLKCRSNLLSRQLQFDGRIVDGVLAVRSMGGDYTGGSVRASGNVYLVNDRNRIAPRADLRVGISRVALEQGLWFLPEAAQQYKGRLSGQATIAGNLRTIRIRGGVNGRELVAYSLPVGLAHSGLMADIDLAAKDWRLTFPAIQSSVGGGQLEGELTVSRSRRRGVDLISRWKTRRVDFFRLTDQLGRASSLAKGEISGELTLRGKSIQSVDDLNGRYYFKLGQTRGGAVPGLLAASQFLGPLSLAQESFDVGEAKGIIGQGVMVLDEFWLGSDNALVRADGKIYLRSGRMDLEAIIATGDYRDISADFNQLVRRYALQSLLPVAAIFSVSELLLDRTLVISVMGTTAHPIVRLRPIETFREEAARFLLREGKRLIYAGLTTGAIDGMDGGW